MVHEHERPTGESSGYSLLKEWLVCPYCGSENAYAQNYESISDYKPTLECPDCETTDDMG